MITWHEEFFCRVWSLLEKILMVLVIEMEVDLREGFLGGCLLVYLIHNTPVYSFFFEVHLESNTKSAMK